MFFYDLHSDIYPISAIKRMVHHAPPKENSNAGYYLVELQDGGTCQISYEKAKELLRTAWKYVPAYPGVVLLEPKSEVTGNDRFHRIGVLAWGIDEEGALQPITGEGVTQVRHWAVLTPDGLVSDQFGGTFANEDHYIAALDDDEG